MLRDWRTVPAAIMGLAGLLIAVLWLAVGIELRHDAATTRASVETQVTNLARAFEEHVLRTTSGIDQALQHLRAEIEHDPKSLDRQVTLLRRSLPREFVVQIGTIDASGRLAYSDLGLPPEPSNLGDREHFKFHRDTAEDVLFITKPVLGRVSGKWSLQFTRRLYGPGGAFAGVIVMSVAPDYFTRFYQSIDVGDHGAVTLLGHDGVIRARATRTPPAKEPMGLKLTNRPFLDPAGPAAGIYEMATIVDGVVRIVAYRRIASIPLTVLVSVGKDEALSAAVDRQWILLQGGSALTVVLLTVFSTVGWLVARQQHFQAAVAQQAQQLSRSNNELEAFAYAISHDLREPLRTVNSFLALLAKRAGAKLDANETEFIKFARDGALRMDRLIVGLLEYSRVGRREHPFESISLSEVADLAVANLRSTLEASHASVRIAPNLPRVLGDGDELVRLFQNLVGNALKYHAADRAPVIVIDCERRDREWIIQVSDNGIGIASEHFERIFGIFQRLHGRDEYDGCGIGLALCRKIVEHHHGRIWLTSREGEGSTFFVALPVAA